MDLIGEKVRFYSTGNRGGWKDGICCGYVYYPVGLYYVIYDEEKDKQLDVYSALVKRWSP